MLNIKDIKVGNFYKDCTSNFDQSLILLIKIDKLQTFWLGIDGKIFKAAEAKTNGELWWLNEN